MRIPLLISLLPSIAFGGGDPATSFEQALSKQDLDQAWFALEQWADQRPEDAEIRFARARTYAALEAPIAALDEIRWIELNAPAFEPQKDLFALKARSLASLGQSEAAWHAWWRSASTDPEQRTLPDNAAWADLEATLANPVIERILASARAQLAETPRDPGPMLLQLAALDGLGRDEEAAALAAEADAAGWRPAPLPSWQAALAHDRNPVDAATLANQLWPQNNARSALNRSHYLMLSSEQDTAYWLDRVQTAEALGEPLVALHAAAFVLAPPRQISLEQADGLAHQSMAWLREADTHAEAADAHWQAGDLKQAIAEMATALAIQPAHPRALAVQWLLARQAGDLESLAPKLRAFWALHAEEIALPIEAAMNQAVSIADWPLAFSLSQQLLIGGIELSPEAQVQRNLAAFAMRMENFMTDSSGDDDGFLHRSFQLARRSENVIRNALAFPGFDDARSLASDAAQGKIDPTAGFIAFLALRHKYLNNKNDPKGLEQAYRELASGFDQSNAAGLEAYRAYLDAPSEPNRNAFIQSMPGSPTPTLVLALTGGATPEANAGLWRVAFDPSIPLAFRIVAYRNLASGVEPQRLASPRPSTPFFLNRAALNAASPWLNDGRRIVVSGIAFESMPSTGSFRLVGALPDRRTKTYLPERPEPANPATPARFIELDNFTFSRFEPVPFAIPANEVVRVQDCSWNKSIFNVSGALILDNVIGEGVGANLLDGGSLAVLDAELEPPKFPQLLMNMQGDSQVYAVRAAVSGDRLNVIEIHGAQAEFIARDFSIVSAKAFKLLDGAAFPEPYGIAFKFGGPPSPTDGIQPPTTSSVLEFAGVSAVLRESQRFAENIRQQGPGAELRLNDDVQVMQTLELNPGVHLKGMGGRVHRAKLFGRAPAQSVIRIEGPSDQTTLLEALDIGYAGSPVRGAAIEVENATAILDGVYPSNKSYQLWMRGEYPFLKVTNGGTVVLRNLSAWGVVEADATSRVILDNVSGDPLVFRGGGILMAAEKSDAKGSITVSGPGARYQGPLGLVRFADGAGDANALTGLARRREQAWAEATAAFDRALSAADSLSDREAAFDAFGKAVWNANISGSATEDAALDYLATALKPRLETRPSEAHRLAYAASQSLVFNNQSFESQLPARLKRQGLSANLLHSIVAYAAAQVFRPFQVDDAYVEDTYQLLLQFPNRGVGFTSAARARRRGESIEQAKAIALQDDRSAAYWTPEAVAARKEAAKREETRDDNRPAALTRAQMMQFYDVAIQRGHTDVQRNMAFQLDGDHFVDWAVRHRMNTRDPFAPSIDDLRAALARASGENAQLIRNAILAREAKRDRIARSQQYTTWSWSDFSSAAAERRESSARAQRSRDLQNKIFKPRSAYGLD